MGVRNGRGGRYLTALLVSGLSLSACTRDPQTLSRRHIQRGDKYLAERKLPEAIIEYRNAVQQVQTSGEAHLKLADGLRENDDLRGAFQEYVKAADLLPERDDVQLRAGNLLLVAGRFTEARARARNVLQRDPNNVGAVVLLSNALSGLNDLDNAVELGKRAVSLEPTRAGLYTDVAVLELARGERDEAETWFKKAIEVEPNSVKPYLAIAQFYRTGPNPLDAERWYKEAVARDPKGLRTNQEIASFYIDVNRPKDAEPYLKQAATGSDDLDAKLALTDYYLAVGRSGEAVDALRTLATEEDSFAIASVRMAMIEAGLGRTKNAYATLDQVLAKDPHNSTALAIKARVLLSENRAEEALVVAKQAVKAGPKSTQCHLILARVQLALRDPAEAIKSFTEALNLSPRSVDAQIELSRLHRQSGEIPTAIDYAERAVKTQPHNIRASLALVQALSVRYDDRPRADVELKQLLQRYPRAPQVYNAAASAAFVRKDYVGARRMWEHALELDPDDVEALSGLSSVYASERKPDEARRRVEARLAHSPDNRGLMLLAAKVNLIAGSASRAEELLKRLVKIDATNVTAFALLGQIYITQHRVPDAKKEFAEVARQQPRSVEAHTMMGLLCEETGDKDEAIRWYEKAVLLDSRAAGAANNLAYLYAEKNTNLDTALQLAQTAKALVPREPSYHDTLGWVYYKKQLYPFAIRAFKDSVELDPKNPNHQFHLGLAYAREGSDADARKALTEALRLRSDFKGADEARRVLSTLVY